MKKQQFLFFLFLFINGLYYSQENSKEIIIPEVNLVDTVNSAKNYAHFRNTLKNSNLADNIYGIKFSGTYKEGIKESLLNGSFDFIVKEVRIKDILFKSSLASDNYDKITNALKVIMIVVLSHRNLLVTNKMFFKYRCEDLGNKKWSFRFVKSEKERVNLEDSTRHFFIVQLNNQGQIEAIESKSLNSQFNDDYHFVSKYKSSAEGISLEKIDATFINSQNHNTLKLSLELMP